MENQKLENIEAISCLLMMSVANIVLIASQVLINTCDSSSLLNSLYVSIIAIFFTFILCILLKQFLGQNILGISEFLAGKPLKTIIGFSYILCFLLRIGVFLKKMSDSMQTVYFPLTHIVFIITLFCIASGIIATLGNNSLFKSMVLIVPILYSTVVFIFMGNSQNFRFENIYPILGNGISPTFLVGFTNIYAFTGLGYLLFLPPKLKRPDKITKIGLISSILMGIYLLICIASILLIFSNALRNSELPPLYISVRFIEFGTFFQRLDAAFIFLCVLGFIFSLNINLFFIQDIIKDITNISNTKLLIPPCLLTSLGIALWIKKGSSLEFLENNISKALYIIFAILLPLIILILALIKKKVFKKGEQT